MLIFPVLKSLGALVVSVHALLAGGPLGWADLAILLNMLEALHESQDLIDVTADGQVIELHVSEDTLSIYDVGSAEVKRIISGEAAIVAAELLSQVSEHGNLHAAEAALLTGLVCELLVSKVRVN